MAEEQATLLKAEPEQQRDEKHKGKSTDTKVRSIRIRVDDSAALDRITRDTGAAIVDVMGAMIKAYEANGGTDSTEATRHLENIQEHMQAILLEARAAVQSGAAQRASLQSQVDQALEKADDAEKLRQALKKAEADLKVLTAENSRLKVRCARLEGERAIENETLLKQVKELVKQGQG